MTLLLRNLTLSLDEPDEALRDRAARRLKVAPDAIARWSIVRRSIDARDKQRILHVYHIEASLAGGDKVERAILRRLHRADVAPLKPPVKIDLSPGTEPLPGRPVIIGFGPAGMFAALWLARHGYRPLVVERGQGVKVRHRDILQRFYRRHDFDPESNLLFGEGGAGAYSDGKLYTRVNDPHMMDILRVFVEHGAKRDVLIDARPHLGSDWIPTICKRIRATIESLGGEIRFGARLDAVNLASGAIESIICGGERIVPGPVLLGIGHSARDTLRMLIAAGVRVVAKPFQVGVRVEHPQSLVDRWQFGDLCIHARLPPAEYHLVARGAAAELGDVFSFCMCPGGLILPTIESHGLIATNGASRASRNAPFANSGLVLTLPVTEVDDDPLQGVAYLEAVERKAFAMTGETYRVPAQRAPDFLADRLSDGAMETSYPLGGEWVRLSELLPARIGAAIQRALQQLDARLPGFAGVECLVTAPESRASAPVRIPRDSQTRESVSTRGLFPIGEGAGYAGGIMSAAADGIVTAETVIRRYAPIS